MTAILFAIHTDAGQTVGLGLICVEARYASVRWDGADGLDRRVVSASQWKAIVQTFSLGLSPKALERSSVLHEVLTGNRLGLTAQSLSGLPVPSGHGPGAMANVLDRLLLSQAMQGPGTLLDLDQGAD